MRDSERAREMRSKQREMEEMKEILLKAPESRQRGRLCSCDCVCVCVCV